MAAASSSSSSPPSGYEVFLSFRGETRENFTSHLFAALSRKQIHTFMDEAIDKGDKISTELLNGIIEGSRIAIIIFSKDYASSKWCLDELVKILECKEKIGQIVIPVFYHVHPSDVRKQTGNFGKAFRENAKRFKNMADKVQQWRDALTEASDLAGHESTKIRPEAKLVDVIVKDVLKKLEDTTVSVDSNGLVGIDSRIEEVKSLLCIGVQDFRIVGIWGMGGMGKTTLAEAIFHQISNEFQGKSFMAKVREESKRYGLEYLRARLLSEILEEDIKIQTSNLPGHIKKRLQQMKVFIVLDDVNELEQLEYLAGGLDRFGAGSKIIVTTRNKQVLEKCGVGYVHKVEGLNHHEALQHFCNHAFKENHHSIELMAHSKRVLDCASGNPLVLKVLGSLFYGKSKQDWKNTVHNLKPISSPNIYDILKISYDDLDWELKNIFLDIACFFKGDDKDYMTSIFDDSYSIYSGVNILVDKSLVTISNNKLEMHDLLQEMGQEIVRRESVEEPGKRSRLWHHEDILRVLNKNKGTDSIKGIFLDLSKISDINLDSRTFANMSNLRLLKFYMPQHFPILDMPFLDMRCKVHLPQGLQYLSDELRYLYWHGYPLRMLPENFNPDNLIELSLPCSKIEQLWEGKKEAPGLKYIDLLHSQYITGIPNLLKAPKLERVNFRGCRNLSCISSSIQRFNHLRELSLSGCTSLKCLPSNIQFSSPITIDLSHCANLIEFPQILGKIVELDLRGTAIEEVPSSIESLADLQILGLSNCKRLKILSTSICKLKYLHWLSLRNCSKLDSFPEIMQKMEHLQQINLESTAIKELPSSIENVQGLQYLDLRYCSKLQSLPQNLWNLKSLFSIDGTGSTISQLPSSITDLNKVKQLYFSGCRGLLLPDSFAGFSSLRELYLGGCGLTEVPQDIGCLLSLQLLDLQGNNFESLPSSIKYLSNLECLSLSNCNMLQSLPELPQRLKNLDAHDCKILQSLEDLPSPLQELGASVLELLSKIRYGTYARCRVTLDFTNCMKLNENTNHNILADSQRMIHRLVLASIGDFYEESKTEWFRAHLWGARLCFPGSRIPEWFNHQSSGSSITIPLPTFAWTRHFIGFALCAVIAFDHSSRPRGSFEFCCDYRFGKKAFSKTIDFDRFFDFIDIARTEANVIYDADHVFLGFDAGLPDNDHHTAVSVDFFIGLGQEKEQVKRVGVCPLYAHPSETKPNTFTVNLVPQTEEECKKLDNEFQNEASTSGSAMPTQSERSDEEEINDPDQQQSLFLSQLFQCLGIHCNCLWRKTSKSLQETSPLDNVEKLRTRERRKLINVISE